MVGRCIPQEAPSISSAHYGAGAGGVAAVLTCGCVEHDLAHGDAGGTGAGQGGAADGVVPADMSICVCVCVWGGGVGGGGRQAANSTHDTPLVQQL